MSARSVECLSACLLHVPQIPQLHTIAYVTTSKIMGHSKLLEVVGVWAEQAVLERALASKGGQQCGLLWRAALGFELSRGRPEAARKVFLRGIHACPWSKVCLPVLR